MSPEPILNPASREPLNFRFGPGASVRDILNFIGSASGINITFTSDYREPPGYTVQLDGVTLEQALQQILSANALFYKVLNERTILVIPDNAQNRAKYEEQVIRTFYLSHADAQEMVQLLNVIGRVQGSPIVPAFVANKTQNSVTVRATAPLVAIMERIIQSNDRPARRGDRGRADPRSQPGARQAVRPRPEQLLGHRHLLAGEETDRRGDDGGLADSARST